MSETQDSEEIDDPRVERVAKALFAHAVKEVKAAIDKIEFDASELPRIFERLRTETDTGQVLIFASYLEDRFNSLMRAQMLHLTSKDADDRLFSGNGPLASFGNRILLSYQLGWITPEMRTRLDTMRAVRNEFAHKAFKASLSDPRMAQRFKVIGGKVDRLIEVAHSAVEGNQFPMLTVNEISPALHNLCCMAVLAEEAFREMIIMPVCRQYRLPPSVMETNYDEAPELLRDFARHLSRTLITLLQRPEPV